ncbi:CvpA family protein [Paenibacillus sp. GCM10027629]
MHVNVIDYIWLGIAIIAGVYGYIRGFVNTFVSIFGICFSFIISILYYQRFSSWLGKTTGLNVTLSSILAFIVLFLVTKYALVIAGGFLNFIAKAPGIHRLNRWSGAIFGVFEWIVISIIIIYLAKYMKAPEMKSMLEGSWVSRQISTHMPDIIAATAQFIARITGI